MTDKQRIMAANYTRLFDILPYQLTHYPQKEAIGYKKGKKWEAYSTQEALHKINQVSWALLELGVQPGDKLAIIASNSPEWAFVDAGMLQIGAVNVPIYPTISEREYNYIFNDAEIKIAFVGDKRLYKKIKSIEEQVPSLQHTISFEAVEGCKHLDTMLSAASQKNVAEVETRKQAIGTNDLATIIYTSGTTGTPKGVMLSHANIISNLEGCIPDLPLGENHKVLSFLPLCHIFERTVTYLYQAQGCTLYFSKSLDTIATDLQAVEPHFFTTVPRLLEKVYDRILSRGNQQTGIKKKLFFWSVKLANQYEGYNKHGWWYKLQLKIADALIFKKWRAALGGNVQGIVTGAAALQPRLGKIFNAAGIRVREGYGQTESSPIISFSRFEEERNEYGTVGMPIWNVEVKLGEQNEVLCKGPNVMMGYYKRPDLTAETVVDGWLRTGDVGEFVDGKHLKITDRIKELFKTSGGKYIAPQVVENKMKESKFIEQICVVGENERFIGALIVPSIENLLEYVKENELNIDKKDFSTNPEIKKLVRADILALNKDLGQVEQIKRFELMDTEWTIESGELTPTMKVKRNVILKRFAPQIEQLFV